MVSRGGENLPTFAGRGARFLNYERQVHLWMRTTRTEASACASALISHEQSAPRQVCLAEGSDGVAKILGIPRNYFAPEAADAIHQRVMRYMRLRRTDQSIDEYTRSTIFSGGRPRPKWRRGLHSRNNSSPFCVWVTQLYRVTRSRWSWRAVAKA